MFSDLMSSRRFAPLFWCQFLSALNDNFLKNALVILLLYKIAGISDQHAATLVTAAGAVFIAPFFILSALGGELADKFDKAFVARRLKFAEILAAGVSAIGFVLHSAPILFVALALFGIVSALFGPTKYGILPDHLKTNELVSGNALVEGATFIAILVGTILGGLVASFEGAAPTVAVAIILLAIACWLTARLIPSTTPVVPDLKLTANPWTSTIGLLKDLKADRRLWIGAMIVSWAWLVGVVAMSLLPAIVKTKLGGTEGVTTSCLAMFTIGIAVGSGIAAKASHERPNLTLVPIGAFLMGLFSLDLAWTVMSAVPGGAKLTPGDLISSFNGIRLLIDLFGIAVAGGLFIVPAFAAVQAWAEPARRARVIAANNVLNAAFMAGSLGVVGAMQSAGVSLTLLFAVLGLTNIVAGFLVKSAWRKEIAASTTVVA